MSSRQPLTSVITKTEPSRRLATTRRKVLLWAPEFPERQSSHRSRVGDKAATRPGEHRATRLRLRQSRQSRGSFGGKGKRPSRQPSVPVVARRRREPALKPRFWFPIKGKRRRSWGRVAGRRTSESSRPSATHLTTVLLANRKMAWWQKCALCGSTTMGSGRSDSLSRRLRWARRWSGFMPPRSLATS